LREFLCRPDINRGPHQALKSLSSNAGVFLFGNTKEVMGYVLAHHLFAISQINATVSAHVLLH
jgi:hypothetical protein